MKKTAFIILIFSFVSCNSQNKKEDVKPTSKTESRQLSGFERHELKYLKSPFKGVFTSKGKQGNLFPIRSTGVSTKPIVTAATQFVSNLTNEQKEKTVFTFNDEEWRKWCNVDNGIYRRQGVSIKELNQKQCQLASELLKKSLSAKGLELSKNIMKTDQTLKELNNGSTDYDEELYYFTIMGTPSETEPWGWQLDGHHLVINYFVLGDQVVMTPTFMGGEPIITTTGKHKGNTLFQDEQNLGLKFMQSLSLAQQEKATLSTDKERYNNKAEAFSDNITLDYEGIKVSELSKAHQGTLLQLANQYISNTTDAHAKVKLEEIKEHLNNTYFAWKGKTDNNAVFYYRIHSPVILIEFDHQGPVGIGRGKNATRNHIHTVIRTPNGNDYGKDLLKQHLKQHKH